MNVGVKLIGKQPNFGAIGKSLIRTIDTIIVPKMPVYGELVVANWDHKPHIKTIKKIARNAIIIIATPAGPNTKFWVWTSLGTEEHDIFPVNAAVLAFSATYNPKTTPGPTVGGPGTSTGPTMFAAYVRHPGTTPRHFEPAWADWIRTWVYDDLNRGISRGVNQVWK